MHAPSSTPMAAVAAATLALALTFTGAGTAHATYPGANGRILFSQATDGETAALVTADSDGSDPKTVLAEGTYLAADWSPDGTRIAAAVVTCAADDCHTEIVTMDADGTHQTHLTSGPGCCDVQPAWSPDGTQIAYAHDNGGIAVIDAGGGPAREVVPAGGGEDASPAWSPDGTTLVFTRSRGNAGSGHRRTALFTVGTDGTELRRITAWGVNAENGDWSPDGGRIVFAGKGEVPAPGAIWVIRPDGTGLRALLNVTGRADLHEPHWSPDGRRLLMQGWLDPTQGRGLWLIDADGTNLIPVPVGDPGRELEGPDWGSAPAIP